MIDPAEACKNVSQDVISLFHRYLTLDDVTGGRARSVVTPLGETFRPCCRVSTSEVCKKNNNLATLATKACWVGRVTIGAISRFAIGSDPRFQCHGHDRFRTTQKCRHCGCLEATAWKGASLTIHTARPIRGEGRSFFSFRFFTYPRYKLLLPRSFNNNFCCRTSAPTIITNNISNERTQQSLPTNQPLTASSSEQSILDFPDDTCRILLRDTRFCSRATKSQTPDVSS
jgi:hypothetical protein